MCTFSITNKNLLYRFSLTDKHISTILNFRGNSWAAIRTPESPNVKKGIIQSLLLDEISEYRMDSKDMFSYEPNPSVSYIENLDRGTILR